MNILFYDTETTGLPDWKVPSGSEHQPHIVQIGAILVDDETRKILKVMDVIIKPEGWEISTEMTDIHGISQEQALVDGLPEENVLAEFLGLWDGCYRVSHNKTFDQRTIRIATKRYCDEKTIEAWAVKEDYDCTMIMAKPIMQMLPKNRYGFKSPKLSEAYKFFCGEDLENAHNALSDATACMEIYYAMLGKEDAEQKTLLKEAL